MNARVISFALLLIVLSLLLCGCAQEKAPAAQETCLSIADRVQKSQAFQELTEVNESYLEKYLLLSPQEVSEFSFRRDATRATPEMILVLKASPDANQVDIKALLGDYHQEQLLQYRDYQPDQVYKLENAHVLEKDAYLALIIAPDAAKAEAALGAGWK